jgi:hypothetical protein
MDKEKLNDMIDVFLELKEISDKLCERIDRKIAELKELEKRIDNKMEEYKKLLVRQDLNRVSKFAYDKRNEVIKLYLSGEEPTKISKIVGIPVGEVELLINLYKIKSSEK